MPTLPEIGAFLKDVGGLGAFCVVLLAAAYWLARWARPHVDAMIEAHKNYLKAQEQASKDCVEQQRKHGELLDKICDTQDRQTGLMETSQRMLEKFVDGRT